MNYNTLKVGDKVILALHMCSGGCSAIITSVAYEKGELMRLEFDFVASDGHTYKDNCSGCKSAWPEIKLISSGKQNNSLGKIMSSLLEKAKMLVLGEPEKTFRKLAIQDDKGDLTTEGRALYESWKFEKDKAAFKTEVCEPLLAELEAEKAKA